MSDINSLTITGRLGADADLKYTQGGEAVLNLRVAVGQRVKRGGEWKDEPVWLTVTVFGKRAEGLAKLLSKGSRVGATGELRVRQYETRDGGKGTSVELFARDVVPLDGKRDGGGQRQASQQQEPETNYYGGGGGNGPSDDEIPFAPVGDVG